MQKHIEGHTLILMFIKKIVLKWRKVISQG